MKIPKFLYVILLLALTVSACSDKKDAGVSLEQVKYNNNKKSYPGTKMDSAQAINAIISQKTQELLDLAVLYSSGNKDTDIDSVVCTQMKGYFYKPDSLTFKRLMKDIDSIKPNKAKLTNLEVYEDFIKTDTLNYAKFQVEYLDRNNSILSISEKKAQYILVPYPVKFKKEFKFYFINFYNPLKDSTSAGVIK